jgi:hypothetical protein
MELFGVEEMFRATTFCKTSRYAVVTVAVVAVAGSGGDESVGVVMIIMFAGIVDAGRSGSPERRA